MYLWYVFTLQLSKEDPVLLMLRGRAHLNMGHVEEASQVETGLYSLLIKVAQFKPLCPL